MNTRSFLIASSLARLAAKTGRATRILEGHFPTTAERTTSVLVEGASAAILVTSARPRADGVERAEIPCSHAEALLAVTAGRIDRLRTSLSIGSQPIHLSRIVSPGPLDLVTVDFDSDKTARAFQPPAWFGPEVSEEPAFRSSAIALQGVPEAPDIEVTNAGLDSLLDALENRVSRQAALTAPVVRSRPAPAPEPETAAADDAEVTTIEDDVIRELARSMRQQRR